MTVPASAESCVARSGVCKEQPSPSDGSGKYTQARRFFALWVLTRMIASVPPVVLVGAPWSAQLSLVALIVEVPGSVQPVSASE
jgi:hypothetical protein